MASVTNPLSSTAPDPSTPAAGSSSSSASSTVSTFNGTSQYAQDLQNAITRAVAIASMPITQLNNRQSLLNEQKAAYESLQTKVESLHTAAEGLATAIGNSSYSAGNTNSAAATANVTAGAQLGTYTINVINAGTFTLAMSNDGLTTVTNPSSTNLAAGLSFTLSVAGKNTPITLKTASLNAMAAAINDADAGVTATVINVGTASAADYRLSLQSTATDNVAIDLTDAGGASLVTVGTPGTQGSYQVNGEPAAGIASTSPTVQIAPGVSATLQAPGTTMIVVNRDTTALATAINTLVSAYNAMATELSQYHGKNGGVLEGQSEIWSTQSSIRDLINFSPPGSSTSLIQLGVSFNLNGQLSFDDSKLSSASMSDLDSFFGDGTTSG